MMVSDSHTSEIAQVKDPAKGDRRIIVIPEMQDGLKGLTKKLTSLSGVRKIAKGVFILQVNNEAVRRVVERVSHISFKKVKSIPKIRDKSRDAKLKRTYALVTYHLHNPSSQQKKKAQRLISKTVSIRLRPGVLLFPHLRVKDNRKYFETEKMKRFLNSKKFVTEIAKLDAELSRFTHLRISGPKSLSIIDSTLERMILRKYEKLSERVRILREAVKDSEIQTVKLKERYSALFQQYKYSKVSFEAIQKIMIIESPHTLKGIYDKLLRIRKMIAERN
jgi:hypothetical protein